jgi:hypothetical protein
MDGYLNKCNRCSYNRLCKPRSLWDVKASTYSRKWIHRWRWGCQLLASGTNPETEASSFDWVHLSRLHLKPGTEPLF